MSGMRVLVVVSDLVASWSKVRRRQVSVPCVESPSQSTVGRSSDTSERKPVAQLSDQMRTEIFEAVKGAVDYFIESRAVSFTQSQLESVPYDFESRCELGRAFEDAVTKVILDHRGAMGRFGNDLTNHHSDVARPETDRLVSEMADRPAGIGQDSPTDVMEDLVEGLQRSIGGRGTDFIALDNVVEFMGVKVATQVIGNMVVTIRDLRGELNDTKDELAQAVSETMREGNG